MRVGSHTIHWQACAPSCYLQKQICRAFGTSFAASLEPLGHCQNVANFSLFYRYYFGKCSSELAELILEGDLLVILIDCIIFLLPFLGFTRMSMSTVSLLVQLDPGILCLKNAFLWTIIIYAFQSESTLYSCLNVKELLAWNRPKIWSLSDCNWTQTQNHLASLAK